ncbi:agmatinase [Kineosporia sp. NBRC 101731]|uniref:agmatinase n=1 Tax=Kineosporia sp. NBRC 101731 TaxID=3032199 RepID=UPI0024A263DC|nr:agmatinase [Kineosporia sp. NBRC 101731]GLY30407.1 agmatinase [Kineosporia sp. NBRC 101731]
MNHPVGPIDASVVPRYSGWSTFARLPRLDEVTNFDLAVLGVPFDGGVTYRPGARFGPAHVRQSSRLLRPYNPVQQIAPFDVMQVVDAGDLAVNPFDTSGALAAITSRALDLTSGGSRLVTIGGDHTIALPLLRAAAERHGPVAVLHFDAHLDTWDTYFDEPYTHGTPFRRAAEEGVIDSTGCVHVGIRGPVYSDRDRYEDQVLGFQIIGAEETEDLGWRGIAERVKARLGDRPVYVSVDIDVLDPAFAPGTGTPEPGGLTSRELLAVLRSLAGVNVVGADIVEVAPAYDHAEITGMAAASVAYELICAMTPRPVSD